jgi:hypothetical protein
VSLARKLNGRKVFEKNHSRWIIFIFFVSTALFDFSKTFHRPQAQLTIGLKFFAGVIFLVKVLDKARFPNSKATDPTNPGPFYLPLPLDINGTTLKISAL